MTTPASKLLQPITVGPLELKNRIMFPPLTTGYEERDGSIGERSLAFYERLARGGVSYIVIGDVAPVMTASPTPKLATDARSPRLRRWPMPSTSTAPRSRCSCSTPSTMCPVSAAWSWAPCCRQGRAGGQGRRRRGDLCRQDGRVQRDPQPGLRQAAPRHAALCERGERRAAHPDQGGHRCLGRSRTAGRDRRYRGPRRPPGGFAVLGHPQPAHRRVRWFVREPRSLRAGGRRRH